MVNQKWLITSLVAHLFVHLINRLRKDGLNELDHVVGELQNLILRPIVDRKIDLLSVVSILLHQQIPHI